MFPLISRTISSKCHLVKWHSLWWRAKEGWGCLCRQGGKGEWGCFPQLPSCREERVHRTESPQQLLVKGREESFGQVWGAGEGDSNAAFLVTHCTDVPIWAFCRGFAARSHLARFIFLGFLASREKCKLLHPHLKTGFKMTGRGRERQYSCFLDFQGGLILSDVLLGRDSYLSPPPQIYLSRSSRLLSD